MCFLSNVHTQINASESNLGLIACLRISGKQAGDPRDQTSFPLGLIKCSDSETTTLPISTWPALRPELQLTCDNVTCTVSYGTLYRHVCTSKSCPVSFNTHGLQSSCTNIWQMINQLKQAAPNFESNGKRWEYFFLNNMKWQKVKHTKHSEYFLYALYYTLGGVV